MTRTEQIARVIWFAYVDAQGYPNGLPTYDELPAHEQMTLRYQARTAISATIKMMRAKKRLPPRPLFL